jgi:hypothetical protein
MQLEGARLEALPRRWMTCSGSASMPRRTKSRSFRPTARSAGASSDRVSGALAGGSRGVGHEPGDRLAFPDAEQVDLVVHYLACSGRG